MSKIKYQIVVNKFVKYKCELLMDEKAFNLAVPNEKTVFKYKTSCGHEREMSYKSFMNGNGAQCVSCTQAINGKKSAEKQRKPFEEVEKFFSDNGCKLIYDKTQFESIYKNCESKLKYVAKCGHEYETTYSIFKNGKARFCKECTYKLMGEKLSKSQNEKSQTNYNQDTINTGKTKLNLKTVMKKFSDNNCTLQIDSNEVFYAVYKNSSSVLTYIAQCGHENSISYKTFCAGSGLLCNACTKANTNIKIGEKQKLDYQTVKSKFDNKNCKLIIEENEFNTKYKNNPTFKTSLFITKHNNL